VRRRPIVSLADLVRSHRWLELERDDDLAAVACVLGLAPAGATRSTAAPGAAAGPAPTMPRPDLATAPPPRASFVTGTAPDEAALGEEAPPGAAEIETLPSEPGFRRSPREVPPLESLLDLPEPPEQVIDTSLFVSRWQRAIISGLAGTPRPAGAIDLTRVVEQIAAGRAVQTLPRLEVHTLRTGLQVLVDIGERMRPFADDVAATERALRNTAGRDSVTVLRFAGTLALGAGPGARRTWKPYRPPAAGTPVLVLSDFGLASAADAGSSRLAWQPLASATASAGCPLIAVTPFPAARWPPWLTEFFTVVQWERTTTAAIARNTALRAARRGR
jgi:hypothetical protein